jgi:hypothetical protein
MIRRFLFLTLLVATAAMGCSDSSRVKVIPVVGKLLVNGQPAAQAIVLFHPLPAREETSRPLAIVQGDGTFRPTTYVAQDGVPPGEYALTVVWPTKRIDYGEEIDGPDRLRGRYGNLATPAATVQIQEGQQEIPTIELKL